MATPETRLSAAHQYIGPERRRSRRIPINYPVRLQYVSPSGETLERYAQARNVSSDGLLCASLDAPDPGMKVDFSIGLPSAYARSLPVAQLNGVAVVARRELPDPQEQPEFRRTIALNFLSKPVLSTRLSMFD